MKTKIFTMLTLAFLGLSSTYAQVGIGTATPDPSAIIDLQSTDKGLLPPRMTTAQRDAITTPANGLLVYNISLGCLQVNSGTPASPVWKCISSSPAPGELSGLSCTSATHNGDLFRGEQAISVNTVIDYTGGSGSHSGQTVNSTDVTGLTATLVPGTFNNTGSLIYTITGTPVTAGEASFAISIGGQMCTLKRIVSGVNSLNCDSATHNGDLVSGVQASGVNSLIPYTGGSGSHSGQTVNSTGVTGLTATLSAGTFASSGTLTYTITGTPASTGEASFAISIGGQMCTLKRIVSVVNSLNCGSATHNGNLVSGFAADTGVTSVIPYTGGSGSHSGQTVNSTGVTGLTATLSAGTFASSGTLTYTITGTPATGGQASFAINIGGETCTLSRNVVALASDEVYNPATGRIWKDRNLGATQVATSSTDADSYGHLYQWGRGTDGHQLRTSGTTTTLSTTDQPGNNLFIYFNQGTSTDYDWRASPNNNLWQGVTGINNPCPSGFRLPTSAEWTSEINSWTSADAAGAFASPLKLPMAGFRTVFGSLSDVGTRGSYKSATIGSFQNAHATVRMFFSSAYVDNAFFSARATGESVRCIKN